MPLRNRLLAVFTVVAGMLTFFVPSVTTDPAVAGVSRWSPFNIVVQTYKEVLPPPACERCGEPLVRSLVALPLWIAVHYLLMVLALVALCFRWSARAISSVAVIGAFSAVRTIGSFGTRSEFQRAFFKFYPGGNVHYGELLAAQIVVMVALLLICLDRELVPRVETEDRMGRRRLKNVRGA